MIHWPDWTIADVLCGFDADPMQGRATVVAQVTDDAPAPSVSWRVAGSDGYAFVDPDDAAGLTTAMQEAQRAAAAALGEVTT